MRPPRRRGAAARSRRRRTSELPCWTRRRAARAEYTRQSENVDETGSVSDHPMGSGAPLDLPPLFLERLPREDPDRVRDPASRSVLACEAPRLVADRPPKDRVDAGNGGEGSVANGGGEVNRGRRIARAECGRGERRESSRERCSCRRAGSSTPRARRPRGPEARTVAPTLSPPTYLNCNGTMCTTPSWDARCKPVMAPLRRIGATTSIRRSPKNSRTRSVSRSRISPNSA